MLYLYGKFGGASKYCARGRWLVLLVLTRQSLRRLHVSTSSANTTSIIPKRYKSVRYGKRLMDTGAAMRWNSWPMSLNVQLLQTVSRKL